MSKLIVANWKQFPDTKEHADNFIKKLDSLVNKYKLNKFIKDNKIIILPPHIYIDRLVDQIGLDIEIGSQDVSKFNQGAFTGEISSKMLKSMGIKYVLVGHSERRINFKEKNEDINIKIANCLHYGLKPILCVGENARTKTETANSFRIKKIIFSQLNECLKGVKDEEIKNIVVVYEPVWAISTSINSHVADINDIETMMINIRFWFETRFGKEKASNVKILYGGSINKNNILNFKSIFIGDGLVIGKASTNVDEYVTILKTLKNF